MVAFMGDIQAMFHQVKVAETENFFAFFGGQMVTSLRTSGSIG